MEKLKGKYVGVSWFCDDIHSGASRDVCFGIPDMSTPDHYMIAQVGSTGHHGFEGSAALVVTAPEARALKAPDQIIRRWEKTGWGGMTVVSFGCSDPDYVALGDLYIREYFNQVRLSDWPFYRCIHKDWLRDANWAGVDGDAKNPLWTDKGSGAQDDVVLWGVADLAIAVKSPQMTPWSYYFKAYSTNSTDPPKDVPWALDSTKLEIE